MSSETTMLQSTSCQNLVPIEQKFLREFLFINYITLQSQLLPKCTSTLFHLKLVERSWCLKLTSVSLSLIISRSKSFPPASTKEITKQSISWNDPRTTSSLMTNSIREGQDQGFSWNVSPLKKEKKSYKMLMKELVEIMQPLVLWSAKSLDWDFTSLQLYQMQKHS